MPGIIPISPNMPTQNSAANNAYNTKVNTPDVSATVSTTHEFFVALVIFAVVGMFLVIIAGQSDTAGNTVAAFLAIILVVQGITHVNPFVSFLANHPLAPQARI